MNLIIASVFLVFGGTVLGCVLTTWFKEAQDRKHKERAEFDSLVKHLKLRSVYKPETYCYEKETRHG